MNGNDFAHFLNLPLLRMPAADIGGEKTRCDGIDHDPVAASTGATECMRWAAPALAAVGSADRRFALMRRNRSRDYHAARPLQAQEPSACVQRCEDAVHVDVDHAVPALIRVILQSALCLARPLRPSRPDPISSATHRNNFEATNVRFQIENRA